MIEMIFPSVSSVASLSALGLLFGLILSIAKIKLKVDKDPRIELVAAALPGANCGACGLPGCSGYAAKIVVDGIAITLCPVGGADSIKKISEIMGIEAEGDVIKTTARVHCQGGQIEALKRFEYLGPKECKAAAGMFGGNKACEYGCLGFGDCAAVCPFNAIEMNSNGLPVIDPEKCTGCGICVTECPKNIISLIPSNIAIYMMCRNREKGAIMLKECTVGCTACKLCERACKEVFADKPEIEKAIEVVDNLAVIDYAKCIDCGKCAEACKKQKVLSFVKKESPVLI